MIMIKIDDFYRLATLLLVGGWLAVVLAGAQEPERDILSAPADREIGRAHV